MREILVGLAVAAVLVVGFAVLYGGAGNKLSARDQALLTEFKQFREFLNDGPIQPAMPDHLIKIFADGTGVPWGPVSPGIDMNFMPTPAPECR